MSSFDQEKHLKPLLVIIAVLLLSGIFWLYTSHQQRMTNYDRKIDAVRKEIVQLNLGVQDYLQLEAKLQRLKTTDAASQQLNLISSVENATEQISARSQLIYVRPQPDKIKEDLVEEGVEIKLEKLKLHQLVELLYQFDQTGQMIKVNQLRLRTRFDNPELLDTSITLSRFREKS